MRCGRFYWEITLNEVLVTSLLIFISNRKTNSPAVAVSAVICCLVEILVGRIDQFFAEPSQCRSDTVAIPILRVTGISTRGVGCKRSVTRNASDPRLQLFGFLASIVPCLIRQYHDEFFAAVTCDNMISYYRRSNASAEFLQYLVTSEMAVRIVYFL